MVALGGFHRAVRDRPHHPLARAPSATIDQGGIVDFGAPLPLHLRRPLEEAFGRSFEDVRLHAGADAARSAAEVGARAYTVGSRIVLGAGAPSLDSPAGHRLLAHELTHVAQRGGAPHAGVTGGAPPGRLARQVEDNLPEEEPVAPLAEVQGTGEDEEVVAMANISLPGRTNASYSSSFTTTGHTTTAGAEGCQNVTGTLVNTFRVTTRVTLPRVPSGLTPCQAANARSFIDGTLAPHEQEHVTAFHTFDGTTSRPFSVTVCRGQSLRALVQAEHNADRAVRQAAAQALSDALDPFNVTFDLDQGCPTP